MQAVLSQLASLADRYRRASHSFVILAIVLPWLLLGGFAIYDYRSEQARAQAQVVATADALAEHAKTVVETADLVLARVLDRIHGHDWATIGDDEQVHDFLTSLKRELPQLESVFLVDPNGFNVASSRGFPLPRINNTSREYYQAALRGDEHPYVSRRFIGQINRTYAFTITRPRLKDGRFDGIVGVTVSPRYFESFYEAAMAHPNASTTGLFRADGYLLVRFPDAGDQDIRLPPDTPMMQAVASGTSAGFVRGASRIDGTDRLLAFRRIKGWPLIVVYAVDSAAFLREWYVHMGLLGFSTILLTLALLRAERLMLQKARDEQEALRRLIEETSRRQDAEAALQQAQKLEALGRLTGGVAHDFNNFLAAILGSLELLRRHVSGDRAVRLLGTATQAAERGARLTAQMLAFARRKELTTRPTDVAATIRGMHDLLQRATGPDIAITYDLADAAAPALADVGQLEVALLNLAVNARDAMPQGGTLTITAATVNVGPPGAGVNDLPPGPYVRLCVRDTGEGMTDAVKARAFEPFFTTKDAGRGTGLGLSMVFGFAELIAGTVTIDSEPGHGTTISLYMPCATTSGLTAASPPPSGDRSDAPSGVREGLRVLVVDDDDGVRTTAQVMLEGLGAEVVAIESGRSALAILQTDRRFDLLIIDFAMPQMNGGELATEIDTFWPDAPMLFVTGYVENDVLRPWRDRGIPTLNKPYGQSELVNAIERALNVAAAGAPAVSERA